MKFRCERDVLVESLGTAARAVVAKGAGPAALAGVHLRVEQDELQLAGVDRDLTIKTHVTVAGLGDALSTVLAVQILRYYVDPSAMELSPSSGLSRERLQRVRDYIEAHLDDRLTLTDLSGVACLSRYHFSRSFKLALGIGPQRYVVQRRLERAKTLMRRTNRSLAWIAQEAGFADQSHLTSVFRRETGMTPGRFRAATK